MVILTKQLLLPLFISIFVNLLLGAYNSVQVKKIKFDFGLLMAGLAKGVIIAVSAIGLSFCFDLTIIGEIGITPDLVMNSAIILYVTKGIYNLASILGVDLKQIGNKNILNDEDDI